MDNVLLWTGLFIIVALPSLDTFVKLPNLQVVGAVVMLIGLIILWFKYFKSRS